MNHKCSSIVFSCIDWRLHPPLEKLLKEQRGVFDLCVTAGAVKGFDDPVARGFLFSQIEISQKLHNSDTAALFMHRDCGAYGGSNAFASEEAEIAHHSKILGESAKLIEDKFPGTKVEKFFVYLKEKNGEWQCELLPIK